jgi:hypothetical protein
MGWREKEGRKRREGEGRERRGMFVPRQFILCCGAPVRHASADAVENKITARSDMLPSREYFGRHEVYVDQNLSFNADTETAFNRFCCKLM